MKKSYHNTNHEQGVILFESEIKAQSQESKILEILKQNKIENLTPELIQENYFPNAPITSIRRAFSNLAHPDKWDVLEKTDIMIEGNYGKNIHTWEFKK